MSVEYEYIYGSVAGNATVVQAAINKWARQGYRLHSLNRISTEFTYICMERERFIPPSVPTTPEI